MTNRTPHVVREEELPWTEQSHGQSYGLRRKQLGAAAGNRKLGCSLYEIFPGRKSFPYHYHCANEEAIYVLEGSGTLRIGGKEITISKGDYIALLNRPEGAHQVINTSDQPLRYLCFSTMIEPDVIVYPDSNKVGILVGSAPGGPKEQRTLNMFLRTEAKVDYWDGEE
jgi:uncharacterized cupin superfamily protein